MSTLEELHSLAEQGDPEAQYQLGMHFIQEGQNSQNFDLMSSAAANFSKAAKQGHFLAKVYLAQLHKKPKKLFKDAEPYISLELYEEIVKENPDDLQVKFELGVMYCTAGAGFMGYGEGYILRDGNRMKRKLKEGRKLIEDVLGNVNPDNLPYSVIDDLGILYCDGWLRDTREPTIDDVIQGIKYHNRAIELAKEFVENRNAYDQLIELHKQSIDINKKRIKSKLWVWRSDYKISKTAGIEFSYGEETFFDNIDFNDNAIIEKLKKSGFDDIANELKQEWSREQEKDDNEQSIKRDRKESPKNEHSEDNEDVLQFLLKTTLTQLNLPDTPETHYDLGNRFLTSGLDVPESGPDAAKIAMYCYKQAADKGHSGAQAGIASGYFSGFGIEKNLEKAEYWARQSAVQGDINGFYSLGTVLASKKDYENAEFWLTKAIEGGHQEAKSTLQEMLVLKSALKTIQGNIIENSDAGAIQNKFCGVCGEQIDVDSSFCGSCGSVVKHEEQTASFMPPHAVPNVPRHTEAPGIPSENTEIPVWLNKRTVITGVLVIILATTGFFAWKIQNDRKLEAAEKARIAKQYDAEKARIAKQVEEAQKVRIAAEEALAAARQDRIAAEQAAAEQALAAEQARIAKQAAEAQKARIAAEQARAAAEKAEQTRAAAAKAGQMAKQLEEIQRQRQAPSSASKQAQTSVPPVGSQTDSVRLTVGTPIRIITSSMISTDNADTGDQFNAILNGDITDNGRVIARRGSIVKGMVSDSDPGGRVKGVASISLQLTSLTLADGREVSVRTNEHSVAAASSVGKDVAKTGIGAGIGAAIGAIAGGARGAAIGAGIGGAAGAGTALATRGDPAVIAAETPITFNLTAPLNVVLK